jgi:integrase
LAGLRQSEAAALTYEQVKLVESGELRVESWKIVGLPARGNAPSRVEIGPDLLEILGNLVPSPQSPVPKNSNLLFPNLPRHASQRTRELQAVNYQLSIVNCPLTFNLLRHSFGANLILQGASLETVRLKMRFAMLEEVVAAYRGLRGGAA